MKKGGTVIRMALLFAALLASLTLVVWRQSQALEVLGRLDGVRAERVVEEARRASFTRRVEQLESRAHVSEAARTRFGMRLPAGDEIVILPLRDPSLPLLAASREPAGGPAARERRGKGDEG